MKTLVKIFFVLFFCSLNFSFTNQQEKTWEVPLKYQKLKNSCIDKPDPKFTGKSLYKIHCSSCHGKLGLGDGIKSKRLKTKVPNFTLPATQNQKDGELYYKSFIGRDEMPNFENKIRKEEERWLLINYIRKMKKQ